MTARNSFARRLLRWFDSHGRKDLPWQQPRSAYRVWLSEVMLQQTRVATVIPYFLRFVETFTSLEALASATQNEVLALWSGLGYYSRARNLLCAAQVCVERHGSDLPRNFDELIALPGIGRSTAAAILAQAHGQRFAILDGNVKRVIARFHGLRGWPGAANVQKQLWELAELHTPYGRIADYTQAIMDLGATQCTRALPRCATCPLAANCIAHRDGLTASVPDRKPRRALPTRQTIMLLLHDRAGRLLLERRPPTGVWAQLWSFPEADDVAGARRIARDRGLRGQKIEFRKLPPMIHNFSHYRLDVTPLALSVAATARMADNPDRRWLLLADTATLGVPAPVRKLFATFAKSP